MKKMLIVQIISIFILAFLATACNKTITEPERTITPTDKVPSRLNKENHKKNIDLPPNSTIIDTIYGGLPSDGTIQPNAYQTEQE